MTLLALAVLVVSGCADASVTSVASMPAGITTATAVATETPAATETPVATVILTPTATPPTTRYAAEFRKNFLDACEAEGAPASVCVCLLEYVESQMSEREFVQMDLAIRLGQDVDQAALDVFTDALIACN